LTAADFAKAILLKSKALTKLRQIATLETSLQAAFSPRSSKKEKMIRQNGPGLIETGFLHLA